MRDYCARCQHHIRPRKIRRLREKLQRKMAAIFSGVRDCIIEVSLCRAPVGRAGRWPYHTGRRHSPHFRCQFISQLANKSGCGMFTAVYSGPPPPGYQAAFDSVKTCCLHRRLTPERRLLHPAGNEYVDVKQLVEAGFERLCGSITSEAL